MTQLRTLTFPIFLAVAAVALAACGGDKEPSGDAGVGGGHGGVKGGSGGAGGGKGGHGGAAATGGAGGSSDLTQTCKDGCKKFATVCAPQGGALAAVAESTCQSMLGCDTLNSCTNKAAIQAGADTCLMKTTCTDLTACVSNVPACMK
jgi:hypothetical protein